MINIGIIDDGITSNRTFKIFKSIEITSELEVRKVEEITSLHGSTCAAIIQKYYPESIFSSIKILGDKMTSSKEQLIKAIEWCIDNEIKVINISLGTTNYKDFEELEKVINNAYVKGIIIVAACDNRDIFTYPASYKNVIGVKASNELEEGNYIFNVFPMDGIDITSCGAHKLLTENRISEICNSYAAPMITSKVCNILKDNPHFNLDEVKQRLYEESVNYRRGTLEVATLNNIDYVRTIEKAYNAKLPKREVDVPLIIVYSYEVSCLLEVLDKLSNSFKVDGYNAVPMCTHPDVISYNYDVIYIPFQDGKNIKSKVEVLYRIYNCDVIILGVVIKIDYYKKINKVNKDLEVDICIFILDKLNKCNYKLIRNSEEVFFIDGQEYSYFENEDHVLKFKKVNLLYDKILQKIK